MVGETGGLKYIRSEIEGSGEIDFFVGTTKSFVCFWKMIGWSNELGVKSKAVWSREGSGLSGWIETGFNT